MNPAQAFREKDRRNIVVLGGGMTQRNTKCAAPPRLYEFDEGDTVTFDEGTHGVLVLGGVGRGKTASFMLPMAASLIDQGLPGLILDIKNNFTDQVRTLAKAAGRESDIVEIGTHPTATPINLLAGLSLDETQQMLESLLISGKERSNNIDWIHKGVRLLGDMAMLLQFVGRIDRRFMPNFVLLDRCINDFDFARTLFRMYLASAYDSDDFMQRAFVKRVQTSAFHILTEERNRSKRNYEEQLAYQLYEPRTVLAAITSDDSLCANLSGMDCALRLDYRELLKKNKIIVLRFKHTQGHAAKLLARFIKEKFYADVYRTLDHDCERPRQCFFMADEFQDVINVAPDNTFDDFSWFSKAREFGCINVVASQSLSSLYTNSLLRDQVNALVANCSTKIVLQNDDPAADAYFRHFCGLSKTLAQLGAAEALVSRFDLQSREQVVRTLHCRQQFERIQTRLAMTEGVRATPYVGKSPVTLLRELDDALLVYNLPKKIRQRPEYVELVTEFRELFCQLDAVEIQYAMDRHGEIVAAMRTLQKRYKGKLTVNGIIEVGRGGIFIDIDANDDVQEDIDDIVRDLLEK